MRRKINHRFLCALILLVAITSCHDDQQPSPGSQPTNNQNPDDSATKGPVLPGVPYDYSATSNASSSIITLGRVLFYDKTLSVSGLVACASCHKQGAGFADTKSLSAGNFG